MSDWIIWCHERRAWWRADRAGYTTSIKEAGRYSLAEATEICEQSNVLENRNSLAPNETMMLAPGEDRVAEFTRGRFHNALRILLNIDMDKLEGAGVIQLGDMDEWRQFQASPWRWFIAQDKPTLDKLWPLMIARGMLK